MMKIKNLYQVICTILKQFYEDGCLNKAASLAYVTLLSIVPLFTIGFSILTAFPAFKEIGAKTQDLIFSHLVATSADVVQQYLSDFISHASQLSIIGVFFLLITSVILVFSMEQTFNSIWGIKRNREGVTAFLLYWAVITLIPLVIATISWIIVYFTSLSWMMSHEFVFVKDILVFFTPYIAIFLVLMLLYITLPNRRVPIKSAAIAAFVATILFEIAREFFGLYINYIATYKVIYGAVAAIPIFLLWLYVSWLVILFGVVVGAVITDRTPESN